VDLTQTGANNGTGNALTGDPANNAPPDPTMQNVFALYPHATIDNGDGLTGTLFFPSTSAQNSYQAVAKIDHHFTQRHTLSVRFGYNDFKDPNPFHDDLLPGNIGGVDEKVIGRGLSANLASTLSNNLVNSFTFGWNRIYANFGCTGTRVLDSAIPSVDRFGNGWDIFMSPFTSFGCTALVSDGQWRQTGTTSYGDSVTWSHGNHTFKFGGDFRNINNKHFRQHEYDWYGQDTWKVRRNLTLTLGLRYQLDGVPYEEGANFSNLLGDPTTAPITMSIVGPGTGKPTL
jgi:hypothetical protein